jgi:hypothetical protein
VTKPVTAEFLATIPARHNDNMVIDTLTTEHTGNNQTSARFAIIVFRLLVALNECPGVVRRLLKLLIPAERFYERPGIINTMAFTARN